VKLHINKQQLNMKNIVIHTIKYKITAKVKNDKGKKKGRFKKRFKKPMISNATNYIHKIEIRNDLK